VVQGDNEYEWLMLIDTDEVWDAPVLDKLIKGLDRIPENANAVCCKMETYIKDEKYRIYPPEPLMPTVMVRSRVPGLSGTRGNMITPRGYVKGTYFHHYTYVRENEREVFNKIVRSHLGDRLRPVDLDKWRVEKWDKIPNCTDLHPTEGYEHCWKGVRVVE
jgi:hypothetical protein